MPFHMSAVVSPCNIRTHIWQLPFHLRLNFTVCIYLTSHIHGSQWKLWRPPSSFLILPLQYSESTPSCSTAQNMVMWYDAQLWLWGSSSLIWSGWSASYRGWERRQSQMGWTETGLLAVFGKAHLSCLCKFVKMHVLIWLAHSSWVPP